MKLSSITLAAGAITTAYGAYSYCNAKKKQQKETAKKVIAVGLSLIVAGAAIRYIGQVPKAYKPPIETEIIPSKQIENAPDYLKPYVHALKDRAVPKAGEPLTQFPSHLSQFPHAGLLATKDGGTCIIDNMDQLPPLEECGLRLSPIVKEIQRNNPDIYASMKAHSSRWGKGYAFMIQRSGYNSFTFGMDKTIVNNYKKGLERAEHFLLQDPDFANRSDKFIVNAIKEIHKTLAQNVKHQDPGSEIHPGVWRKIQLIVADGKMAMSKSGMAQYLKAQNAPQADFDHLESWFAKRDKYGSTEAAWRRFTPGELATLKKVAHLPVHFEEIPSAMLGFAAKLKEIYSLVTNRLIHPIAPAAWVHQTFGDIHPFADINGRVCRSLANSVLEWGGIKGLVFPSEEAYTAAVQANQKSPGSFVDYFIDVIKWNSKQKAFQV